MPPRAAEKPNWQLIVTIASMSITVLTLLVSFIWNASTKNANLDLLSQLVATNTLEIKAANAAVIDLKLDIKGLKDQNQALMDQISEIRGELQSKKER